MLLLGTISIVFVSAVVQSTPVCGCNLTCPVNYQLLSLSEKHAMPVAWLHVNRDPVSECCNCS